jgi:hypothetical protein|tara:strand:- start:12301 stop:12699 length:399 start_codon:yes stop_codon:yes gene_type:complete
MAYQLQPGIKLVTDNAVPTVCANEEVFMYPQPTSLNYVSSRPNTMLYGTAPYMAGKGSPAEYIETSDMLRPQSTSRFNKVLAKTYEQNLHPLQNVSCKLPLRTQSYEPSSTRAELQNGLFQQRYLNKNVSKK